MRDDGKFLALLPLIASAAILTGAPHHSAHASWAPRVDLSISALAFTHIMEAAVEPPADTARAGNLGMALWAIPGGEAIVVSATGSEPQE